MMQEERSTPGTAWIVHLAVLLYLLVPVGGTVLYSFSTKWDLTFLPSGLTLSHYTRLLNNPQIVGALIHSLIISAGTVVLLWVLVTPAMIVAHLYLPWARKVLEIAAILPYAIPPVILAVGLIQIYSRKPFAISGTPAILIGSYAVICLPFMVGAIGNSLRAIDARVLMEAAESLGATRWSAITRVLLPNMTPGILSSGLLTFAVCLGEFVLANMLVGSRYETIQVRLVQLMRFDGFMASALVVFFFVFVGLASVVLIAGVNRFTGGVRGGRGA